MIQPPLPTSEPTLSKSSTLFVCPWQLPHRDRGIGSPGRAAVRYALGPDLGIGETHRRAAAGLRPGGVGRGPKPPFTIDNQVCDASGSGTQRRRLARRRLGAGSPARCARRRRGRGRCSPRPCRGRRLGGPNQLTTAEGGQARNWCAGVQMRRPPFLQPQDGGTGSSSITAAGTTSFRAGVKLVPIDWRSVAP